MVKRISIYRRGEATMTIRKKVSKLTTPLFLFALSFLLVPPPVTGEDLSEIPAGTRFVVELRDKLEAKKIKKGKKFEARTLEALRALDGSAIPAGAKLKGRVSHVERKQMALRFEEIDTRRGKVPLIASAVGVLGEKDVKAKVGEEGEIRASGGRGKTAAIGAAVGAALGTAVGVSQGGTKNTAVGAGTGAAAGALIGAAAGGKDLVLLKGTRIEVELDRPLLFEPRR